MKASLKVLTIGLLLLVPFSTAHAQGPSLSPIADMSLNAGTTRNVNVIAIDVAGRPVTVTAALPPFVTLNAPTIGTGVVVTSLTLTPTGAQVGDYSAEMRATAGGVTSVRVFRITVNAAGSNQAPVVTSPALEEVTAGSPLSFVVTATDPDGDAIASLGATGLPPTASFPTNSSNTSGTFTWTPGTGDAGEYDVLFTAANALSGTSVTHIRVASAPTLMITPISDVTVAGGGFVSVPVHASGVPGVPITLTAVLPSFATLNPPGSGTGAVNTTVSVSPPLGSAGTYHASITATAGAASVTAPFDIIVTGDVGGGNHPPVLTAPATATVAIGSTLSFDVTATDADGDHVDLIGSALPPGSGFVDHLNDTGTFTWTPTSGQAGTYTASFTGTDGRGGSGSASTVITVTGGSPPENHPPTVSAPATEQVNQGVNLTFAVTATDPDGDHVTLSTGSLPSGASFLDNGDNTGTFSWTPSSTQSGPYSVAFLGYDGRGGSGTASTSITVAVPGGGGGGGGGDVPGRACLVGKFKAHRDTTWFRVRPVHHSFDLGDVVLSSLRLQFHDTSIPALVARVEIRCHDGHGDGDDDGDDDHGGGDHRGGAATHAGGDHGDGDHHDGDHHDDDGDDDACGVSCHDHHDGDHDDGEHDAECDTLGIRAGFATEALLGLFPGSAPTGEHSSSDRKRLPCVLMDAEIRATLTSGATVHATFGDHGDDQNANDDGGGGKGKGKGGSGDDAALGARVRPNPLNPTAQLSFTTTRDGQVRVMVYDMQGRIVKKLMDEYRPTGQQTTTWDGTSESGTRVASGVYFVKIVAPEAQVTRRVAVVK